MDIRKLFLGSLVSVVTLFAGTYEVDKSHSSIAFKVKHMMISNVKGSFDEFSGKYVYDEKTNTLKSLMGEIKVSSINTANTKRDNHLKAPDMFDASSHPNITFKLSAINGDKAYGELTMKGITKKVVFDYESGGSIKNSRGKMVSAFALSGEIKRSDYGITWNKALEAGGVAVSDEVKLEIEVEGKEIN